MPARGAALEHGEAEVALRRGEELGGAVHGDASARGVCGGGTPLEKDRVRDW